jgi:hypothetical protein
MKVPVQRRTGTRPRSRLVQPYATTIVLFVLAIALGIWAWVDRGKVTSGEKSARENNVFPAWRRDDLARVEIAHDDETIVLERDAKTDTAWRLTSPRRERADQAAVERLMTTLEFATRVRKVDSIGEPRAHGSIVMGGVTFRFVLGGPSPRPEGSSYFRVDDGAPFVVSKELTEALLASSDGLRDRTVVPYLSLDLKRFEVTHAGGGFVLERKDERTFLVGGLAAGRPETDKVWSALAEMRAEAFPKDVDPKEPLLTIRMTAKDAGKPPGELAIGGPCPGHPNDVLVLRTQPTRVLACAPKGALDALVALKSDDLVDRRPVSFRHDEIEEMRLEGERVIEIARRGTGFHQRAPEDRELNAAEADAASELLVHIEQSRADEVTRGGGPFSPIAKARFTAGGHDETIEIGAPASARGGESRPLGDRVTMRRLRDDARLVVSRAVARRFLPRLATLKPRAIVNETRRVKRVLLRCGVPQELVDDGAGFRLVVPTGYDADGTVVQLVDGILRDKALAWVSDTDDGSFGLGEGCKVVLAFEDGNAPLTIRFGAEGEGGVYAKLEGAPEVFVAPRSLHTLASRIYVSTAALSTDPANVASVTVRRGAFRIAREPSAVRLLLADRVSALGTPDVGPIEIEVLIAWADGGAPKRVVCGPVRDEHRRCSTAGVKATFDVHRSRFESLLADAGP